MQIRSEPQPRTSWRLSGVSRRTALPRGRRRARAAPAAPRAWSRSSGSA